MAQTPIDINTVLDRYRRGIRLRKKGSQPQMEDDYAKLMEDIDSLDKRKRQAIVQAQIDRLISLRWEKIPKSRPKFGEALELELGVPTQNFSHGDLLGLELKTSHAGLKTRVRLGTELGGEVANHVRNILERTRKSTRENYDSIPSIVYAGKYRATNGLPEIQKDEDRKEQGFLLTNGEVLTVDQPNRLGRVKFTVNQRGILRIGVKPSGYTKWMWGANVSLHESLKKFKNGFLFGTYLQYRKKWVLVDVFKVKLNTGILIHWIRQGKIGLEIRYNCTNKGMENKGDAFGFSDGTIRELIIDQTHSERLSEGYVLPQLS